MLKKKNSELFLMNTPIFPHKTGLGFRSLVIGAVTVSMLLVGTFVYHKQMASSVDLADQQLNTSVDNSISPQSIKGEKALEHLRQTGGYDSIAEAMNAAIYMVEPGVKPNEFRASNQANGMSMQFDRDGLEFVTRDGNKTSKVNWQLKSIGFGDQQLAVPSGNEIKSSERRVEIEHGEARITQWFENKNEGLEQGFTVHKRPVENQDSIDPMRIVLQTKGDLKPRASKNGKAITLIDSSGQTALAYEGLKVWDSSGKELSASMKTNRNEIRIDIVETDAEYPITIDPVFVQQKKLIGTTASFEYFGSSVGLDGNTAVVGSDGAAYVFVRNDIGGWTQEARLVASDISSYDLRHSGAAIFGMNVAISGDTIVIGFQCYPSAYVFVRNGGIWTEQQKLFGDRYFYDSCDEGAEVDIDGDLIIAGGASRVGSTLNDYRVSASMYYRDGNSWSSIVELMNISVGADYRLDVAVDEETAVVGVPGAGSGSAYVFAIESSLWVQQAILLASDGANDDSFGSSVDIDDDTIIVGSPTDDIGTVSNMGSAYVFVRSGNLWSQQQKLVDGNSGTEPNKYFGSAVAIEGNTIIVGRSVLEIGTVFVFARNGAIWTEIQRLTAADGEIGDGFRNCAISGRTVLVTATYDELPDYRYGSAYVFQLFGDTWSQQKDPISTFPGLMEAGDLFGYSVAINGNTAIVGVPLSYGMTAADQGSAYVFVFDGSTWSYQARLRASDGSVNDYFGYSVDVSGDSAIVGATLDDDGLYTNRGSAYVFVRTGTTWTQQSILAPTNADAGSEDRFGWSVSITGDRAIVGAPYDDIGANTDQGSAYMFIRNGTTWTQQAKVTGVNGAAFDNFGFSVGNSGGLAIVGAPGVDVLNRTNQGSAVIFNSSSGTWVREVILGPSDAGAGDSFGFSVAIMGTTAIVGANLNDIGANANQGSAYIFIRSGTTWTQKVRLLASDGAAGDEFGRSVSMSPEVAIVGAPVDDIGANVNQGSAYVYVRNDATWDFHKKLTSSDGGANDQFGRSVAIEFGSVLIGSPYHNSNDIGAAYFYKNAEVWGP